MSQPVTTRPASPAAKKLAGRLSQFASRRLWMARFAWLLAMLWTAGILAILILLMDAAWHLPAGVRLLLGGGLIVLGVAALAGLVLIRRRAGDPAQLHDAMILEKHHHLRDNPVVSGLQLAMQRPVRDDSSAALTEQLRQRVLERASWVADAADLQPAQEIQAVRRHGVILLIVLGVAGGLLTAQPGLWGAGLVRLTDPWGDHPPYSLTRFEIDAPIEAIVRHQDVIVQVKLAGQQPESLQWVELDAQGREKARWPVERIDASRYERRLRQVRDDVYFRLVADTGYTRAFHLRVVEAPSDVADDDAALTLAPTPEETPATQAAASQPAETDLSQHPQMQAMAQRHRELVETAQAVESGVEKLQSAGGASAGDLLQVSEAADRFARQAREAQAEAAMTKQQAKAGPQTQQTESASDSGPPPSLLEQTAAGFEQLLEGLQIPLQPGAPSSEETQALAAWCESMSQAASHDLARLLGQSQGSAAAAMGAGSGQGDSGESARTQDDPPAALDSSGGRLGVIRETLRANQGQVHEHEARSRQVPPAYRMMVQQYFDRINQEQSKQ